MNATLETRSFRSIAVHAGRIPPFENVHSYRKNHRKTPLTNGRESEVHADVAGVAGSRVLEVEDFFGGRPLGRNQNPEGRPLLLRGTEPLKFSLPEKPP